MNIVLVGAPGSGKGTQAKKLVERFNLKYIETGDLSREWAEKDERIKEIVNSGKLIPEKEMTNYVLSYIEDHFEKYENILFEGFPRFLSQYKFLEGYLYEKKATIDCVIYLHMTDKEIIRRLSARRTCKKCDRVFNLITNPPPSENRCVCGGELFHREDDNAESIKVRLKMFKENSIPMIEYIKGAGKLIQVNGTQSIDKVFLDILQGLGVK